MTDLERKVLQRREGVAARRAIPPAVREAYNQRICAALLECDWYRRAHTILLYTAVGGEVSLAAFAEAAEQDGKVLSYPLCLPGHQMDALHPSDPEAWEEGAYHIPAPVRERSELVLPEALDLVLVPCTRFDGDCRRVGMGGGYYDRYLPKCTHAKRVGIAYECQRTDRAAVEPWDVPLDAFVTENGWVISSLRTAE